MKATALVCDENQDFTLEPVRLDGPAPHQVAIRTHYTGVSIGTELGYVSAKTPVPYPLSTGYQGTGIIEAVGDDVSGFDVGDRVYFRRNDSMELEDGTKVTCTSGAHCSHAITDPHTTHGVAKLPPGARMDVACMYVMPAVGLYGVDMANPRMGEVVVVYGVGLIGLGVVAACAHRGCVVVAVDLESARVVWRYRPAGSSFPFYASAAVAGGRVIAGGRDSQVHAIDAGTGEALWVFAAGGRVDASPVIAGARVYAASMRGRLHGLDLATGAEMWTFEGASAFAASPAVASGRLVIGDTDGVLYCFAASTVETE